MRVFISNEEVVVGNSFEINEEILSPSSVVLSNVYPKSWETDKDYTSRFYHPKDYSVCKITDDDLNVIFAGIVKKSGNINLNPRYPHYVDIQVIDFKTFLSEGKSFDFVLSNVTVAEAIERVVNEVYDYGVRVGDIAIPNDDKVIGAYSCQDQTAYDVFQYLSEITQSLWFARYDTTDDLIYIDYYTISTLPSANLIEYTTQYFKDNEIVDMSYSFSTDDYRNKQIITSSNVTGSVEQTENILTDGVAEEFNLQYNVSSISSIKVNGVSKTFISSDEEALGLTADFYYTKGSNTLKSDSLLTTNRTIEIKYYPYILGRQIAINNNEVTRISNEINRNGTITRYEDRNDTTSSEELQAIAEMYIAFKGQVEITLSIKSQKADLFEIGQKVMFDAPIEDLETEYMVKSKKISHIVNNASSDPIIYELYTYELSSNFNEERAINYFDNQRRKLKGNIESGGVVERNIDINNTANIIFQNLTIEEITETEPNLLQGALQIELIKDVSSYVNNDLETNLEGVLKE